MPEAVEIYICKKGQKVEDGQMVMSHDIDCKEAAEEDALSRCKIVPSIERIVYYDVSDGGFRVLYSYTNPDVKETSKKRAVRATGGKVIAKKKKALPKKKSFWQKLFK